MIKLYNNIPKEKRYLISVEQEQIETDITNFFINKLESKLNISAKNIEDTELYYKIMDLVYTTFKNMKDKDRKDYHTTIAFCEQIPFELSNIELLFKEV